MHRPTAIDKEESTASGRQVCTSASVLLLAEPTMLRFRCVPVPVARAARHRPHVARSLYPADIRIYNNPTLFVAPVAVPSPQGSLPLLGLSRISLPFRLYSAVATCVLFCIFHLSRAACSKLP